MERTIVVTAFVAAVLVIFVLLRAEPPQVVPVDQQLVAAHLEVTHPSAPTSVVKVEAAKPKAKKGRSQAQRTAAADAEVLAYAQAQANAARARCLVANVDHKIGRDIQYGYIRDIGNVREWEGCVGKNLRPFMSQNNFYGLSIKGV